MKLLHHLLTSAVCVAALIASTATPASAQVVDPSYSGSGSEEAAPKFLRRPDDSDNVSDLIENDDDSVVDLDLELQAVEIGLAIDIDDDGDRDGKFVNNNDIFIDLERSEPDELATLSYIHRLKGSVEAAAPVELATQAKTKKPATSKPVPSKPATKTPERPKTTKPTHTHAPTKTPIPPPTTPTVTPSTEITSPPSV